MGHNEGSSQNSLFPEIIPSGEFRYIVFDAIYCKKGNENLLGKLFESVCAAEGFNTDLPGSMIIVCSMIN